MNIQQLFDFEILPSIIMDVMKPEGISNNNVIIR